MMTQSLIARLGYVFGLVFVLVLSTIAVRYGYSFFLTDDAIVPYHSRELLVSEGVFDEEVFEDARADAVHVEGVRASEDFGTPDDSDGADNLDAGEALEETAEVEVENTQMDTEMDAQKNEEIREGVETDTVGGEAPDVISPEVVDVPQVAREPQSESEAVQAPKSEAALTQREREIILDAHNAAREARGIPTLAWSPSLALSAEAWATHLQGESCMWYHSDTEVSGLGENIFYSWNTDTSARRSADEPVFWWLAKEDFYSYEKNTCEEGKVCGHYTQVVWENTSYLGCGRVYCDSGDRVKEVWVCQYDPPGNVVGQKPY
jgi:pathogenesis-related protein 1